MTKKTKTKPRASRPVAAAVIDETKMLPIKIVTPHLGCPERALRKALGNGSCAGHNFGGRAGWHLTVHDGREWLASLTTKSKDQHA